MNLKTLIITLLFSSALHLSGCTTTSDSNQVKRTPEAEWSTCVKSVPEGKETATEPYPRTQDYSWMSKNEWCGRVKKVLSEPNRLEAKIGFMGDSISQGWPREYLAKKFGALKPVKMGIGGDKTQSLLWRIDNGELKGMVLENLVLQIGTNNLDAGDSPEDVAKGIELVIKRIHRELPKVHVILTAIFPRGKEPTDPLRARIDATNRILSASVGHWNVGYMDIGSQLLEKDRTISKEIMDDFVHPTIKGYRIWADEIATYITKKESLLSKERLNDNNQE